MTPYFYVDAITIRLSKVCVSQVKAPYHLEELVCHTITHKSILSRARNSAIVNVSAKESIVDCSYSL